MHLAAFVLLIVLQFQMLAGSERSCGTPLGSDFVLQSNRIVAGYDIGYYRYPWLAALIQFGEVGCGGSLIGPKTVVTAAHCFRDYLDIPDSRAVKLENVYTVRLGMYNICQTENTTKDFKVQSVEVHELYRTKNPYYDICLLTLEAEAEGFTPICLPARVVAQLPREGTVAGLGTLRYQGDMPCTVHEARVLVYDDAACRNMINTTGNDPAAVTKAFCAGYLWGGIDACQGDSGGPLQAPAPDGRLVLLGLVSFGFECAKPGVLGMYTDVSQYLDWVRDKTGIDSTTMGAGGDAPPPPPSYGGPVLRPPKKKRPHRRPYWRPIRIIIIRGKNRALRIPSRHH